MAIVGLDMLHFAKITQEDKTQTVYGEVKPFGPAMALNLVPSTNRANLRADNGVLFSEVSEGPMAVTVNPAYLEDEVEAEILGKELDENGGLTDSDDDNPPYIAIGGRAKNARGGYDYFWIHRVKLSKPEVNMETKQETPTFQTPSLTGEAIGRLHDKSRRYKLWDKNPKITDQKIFEQWFDNVIDKNFVPEV